MGDMLFGARQLLCQWLLTDFRYDNFHFIFQRGGGIYHPLWGDIPSPLGYKEPRLLFSGWWAKCSCPTVSMLLHFLKTLSFILSVGTPISADCRPSWMHWKKWASLPTQGSSGWATRKWSTSGTGSVMVLWNPRRRILPLYETGRGSRPRTRWTTIWPGQLLPAFHS